MVIIEKYQDYLYENYSGFSFNDFILIDDNKEMNNKCLRKADEWKTYGFGDYCNIYYDHMKDSKEGNWMYNISQFFTFYNKRKNIKLYRGITKSEEDGKKIVEKKKVFTRKLTAFTDNKRIALEFAYSVDERRPYGILFEININSKDIFMTYKDWLKEEDINEWEGEFEYIIINNNQELLNVRIINKYKHEKRGVVNI